MNVILFWIIWIIYVAGYFILSNLEFILGLTLIPWLTGVVIGVVAWILFRIYRYAMQSPGEQQKSADSLMPSTR